MTSLLTRDEFREAVFKRDRHRCVICKLAMRNTPAVNAHHIMERRLFPNGGYFVDNGASLCEACHLAAEMTTVEPDVIRGACGITTRTLPDHLYPAQDYDKWGNPILPSGLRLQGELFEDPNVQKILRESGILGQFESRVKYPRSHHLPFSPGMTKDDRVMPSTAFGDDVVVTEKMDGGNATLYRDYLHARSVETPRHPSFAWLKNLHARISHDIPENYRICGENLFAKHSIHYKNLKSYFTVFSVWDGLTCLSWDDTVEWATLLELDLVPVLYRGPYEEARIRALYPEPRCEDREGYVVRDARSWHMKEFSCKLGKFVRAGHVSPETHHWRATALVRNELAT